MADKIRHQPLGKIIAEQNDPLFPNSPSKNGFILLWVFFFVYYFSPKQPLSYQITSSWLFLWHSSKQELETEVMNSWAASRNTTDILLQGLLSKLVCGLDTSVKTFFFYKTNSVINTTHQDFVLMAGLWKDRMSTVISAQWFNLSPGFKDSHPLDYVHPNPMEKDSWQINKTIQWYRSRHSEHGLSYGQW